MRCPRRNSPADVAVCSPRCRQQQELAERARQLADRSDRLAAHEAALRHERAEWLRDVQQQRAELEAERFLLKAAKVAWKSKRALLATAATATTTSTTKPPAGSGATDQTAADHTPRPKRTSPPDPELARAAFNRGRALLERHQHQLAATTFHSAVQQDPGEPLYHYFLAIAQYEGGDRHAAEQNVRQAVQLERHRPIGNWGQIMLRHRAPRGSGWSGPAAPRCATAAIRRPAIDRAAHGAPPSRRGLVVLYKSGGQQVPLSPRSLPCLSRGCASMGAGNDLGQVGSGDAVGTRFRPSPTPSPSTLPMQVAR